MSEEQAQQLIQEMQVLEAQYEDLSRREQALVSAMQDAARASESVRALAEENPGTLVPVGSGVYVPAAVDPAGKAVINVGAGAALEKDYAATADYLEARMKGIEVALREVSARRTEAASRLEQGREHMNRLMQEAQQRARAGQNV